MDKSFSSIKWHHTVFFKLLISFLILSVVPIMVSVWLTYFDVSRTLNEKLSEDTQEQLEQKTKVLTFYYEDLSRMGQAVSNSPTVINFLKNDNMDQYYRSFFEMDDVFHSIHNIRPENLGITVVSDKGFTYHYGYSLNKTKNFHEYDWIQPAEKMTISSFITPLHSRPYSNDQSEDQVFSYVQQVSSFDLKSHGLFIIDFSPQVLETLFYSESQGESTEQLLDGFFILDGSGEQVYPSTTIPLEKDEIFKMDDRSPDTVMAEDGQTYKLLQNTHDETGWTIYAYYHENKLYEPVDNLKKSTLFITFISVIICIFLSLIISKRISDPIQHLTRLMRTVGKGDFSKHFELNRKDEFGSLATGFNQMNFKIKNLIDLVNKEQKAKRRAEITALQSQINPHFVYNTLETINSLARKKKEYDISKLIVLLGKLLRISIGTFDEMIPIKKEIEYVKYYLDIYKIRFKNSFEYEISIAEDIHDLYTIKWIVQPLVENSLIHGLANVDSMGQLSIFGWAEGEDIYIQIKDNGVGISEEKLEVLRNNLNLHYEELTKYNKKVGLYNVQSRIRMNFGFEYGLFLESKQHQGMTVTIKFPRRYSNELV